MYKKYSVALGAALAVGVAGVAGGAMAKVEGDTIIPALRCHLQANTQLMVFIPRKAMISLLIASIQWVA